MLRWTCVRARLERPYARNPRGDDTDSAAAPERHQQHEPTEVAHGGQSRHRGRGLVVKKHSEREGYGFVSCLRCSDVPLAGRLGSEGVCLVCTLLSRMRRVHVTVRVCASFRPYFPLACCCRSDLRYVCVTSSLSDLILARVPLVSPCRKLGSGCMFLIPNIVRTPSFQTSALSRVPPAGRPMSEKNSRRVVPTQSRHTPFCREPLFLTPIASTRNPLCGRSPALSASSKPAVV